MCLHDVVVVFVVVVVVVISIWLHHIHDVTPFACHSTWISLVTLVSAICDGFLNWSILFNCKHRLFYYCVEKNKPLRSIYLNKLTKEDAELNTGFRAVYIWRFAFISLSFFSFLLIYLFIFCFAQVSDYSRILIQLKGLITWILSLWSIFSLRGKHVNFSKKK